MNKTTFAPDYPAGFPEEESIEAQAHFWAIYSLSDACTDADMSALDYWLDNDSAHVSAYNSALQLSAALTKLKSVPNVSEVNRPVPLRPRFQLPAKGVMGLAAAACVIFGLFWMLPTRNTVFNTPDQMTDQSNDWVYSTEIGQQKTITLADGSIVDLNGDTQIEVKFYRDARDIILTKGHAQFDIFRDLQRPLTVKTDTADIRVLGTGFDVKSTPSGTSIAVLHGRVDIVPTKGLLAFSEVHKTLKANDYVTVDPYGDVSDVTSYELAKIQGWKSGRYYFQNTPIRDVAAELNRMMSTPITIKDDEIGNMKMTMSFHIDQADKVIAATADSLALDIIIENDQITLTRRVLR